MLDDLRNSTFIDEEEEQEEATTSRPVRKARSQFLGMTAPQRFVLVLLLFLMVCLLGSFTLIISEKIVLPFI